MRCGGARSIQTHLSACKYRMEWTRGGSLRGGQQVLPAQTDPTGEARGNWCLINREGARASPAGATSRTSSASVTLGIGSAVRSWGGSLWPPGSLRRPEIPCTGLWRVSLLPLRTDPRAGPGRPSASVF